MPLKVLLDKSPSDGTSGAGNVASNVNPMDDLGSAPNTAELNDASRDKVIPTTPVAPEDAGKNITEILGLPESELEVGKPPIGKQPVKQTKVETPIVEPVKQVEAEPSQPKQDNGKPKRDFSMFREEHRQFAESVPNKVFDWLKEYLPKVYEQEKKFKEVESKTLPESWMEHPQAVTLSEEFQQIRNDSQYAAFEVKHWREQLLNVRNGAKTYKHLDGYDKDGKPVFTDHEVNVDNVAAIEEAIRDQQNGALTAQNKLSIKANELVEGWRGNITKISEGMRQAETQYYPFLEKPTEDQAKIMSQIHGMIPSQLRRSPLVGLLVKAGTTNVLMANKVKELGEEIARLKGSRVDAIKAGPSGSEVVPQGAGSNSGVMSKDMFPELVDS